MQATCLFHDDLKEAILEMFKRLWKNIQYAYAWPTHQPQPGNQIFWTRVIKIQEALKRGLKI